MEFETFRNKTFYIDEKFKKLNKLSISGLYFECGVIKCYFCDFRRIAESDLFEMASISDLYYMITESHLENFYCPMINTNTSTHQRTKDNIQQYNFDSFMAKNSIDSIWNLLEYTQKHSNDLKPFHFPDFFNTFPDASSPRKCPFCFTFLLTEKHDLDWHHALMAPNGCSWLNQKYRFNICLRVKAYQYRVSDWLEHVEKAFSLYSDEKTIYALGLFLFSKFEKIYKWFTRASNVVKVEQKCPICSICFDSKINRVIIRCGHTICSNCILEVCHASQHPKCPFCQQQIEDVNKLFI